MAIVDRIKRVCLQPKTEWDVIGSEDSTTAAVYRGYVMPLAAIPAIAGFIGGSLVGQSSPFGGTYRIPLVTGLGMAVYAFVMGVLAVFLLSVIINVLAPRFGGEKTMIQALKVAAYSCTPGWIAGVLTVVPFLGMVALLGWLYSLYLLYLGLPRLMKCPANKAFIYTILVVVCAIVLSVLITVAGHTISRLGMVWAPAIPGASSTMKFDKDSQLGKLQAMSEALEESNRKMEAAKKSGDPKAQAAAAMAGLGALLGGGKRFDPLGIDQLRPFLPQEFAGLPRVSSKAEKIGVAGMMVSKASASYGDRAHKSVSLDVIDTGGAAALMALAAWMNVQDEREDDDGFERTRNIDGRFIHEKSSKNGHNEYVVALGDRFMVSANGRGVDFDALKAAVSGLDLAKLEALKSVGVQK